MNRTHTLLILGMAFEAKGNHDGACAAYGTVLQRWGHAKPRPVSADKALGCPLPAAPQ